MEEQCGFTTTFVVVFLHYHSDAKKYSEKNNFFKINKSYIYRIKKNKN